MIPRVSLATAVVAFTASATAQLTSTCNPIKQGVNACPPNPAFGSDKVSVDFTQGASDAFDESAGAAITYGPNGAVFAISQAGQAPSFISSKYIFFGTVEVTMQVAKGQGIVSTFFLSSDVLDEIDWEWLGGSDKNSFGQSNYFSSHNIEYGVNEIDIPINNPQGEMHTYKIDWSPTELVWSVDGNPLRTLTYAGNENTYPQTPMQVKLGTWCGGCSDAEGTAEWAGGKPDWSQSPFVAYYKSITIQDSSNGVANAVSYQYTDTSGSMTGIKVNTGSSDSGSTNNGASSPASESTVSSTQSAATTQSTAPTVSGAGAPSGPDSGSDSGSNNGSATATGTQTAQVQTTLHGSTASSSSNAEVSSGQQHTVSIALLGACILALYAL